MTAENPYKAPSSASAVVGSSFKLTPRWKIALWVAGMLFAPMSIAIDERFRVMSEATAWSAIIVPFVLVTLATAISQFSIATRCLMWIASAFLWWVLITMTLLIFA